MSVSLTVMTFNLHEDQAEDSPNSWEKRKDLCISVITNYSPMILCTQQGLLLLFLHICLGVILFLVVFSVDRMFWYLSFLLGTWVFVLLSSSWVVYIYIYIRVVLWWFLWLGLLVFTSPCRSDCISIEIWMVSYWYIVLFISAFYFVYGFRCENAVGLSSAVLAR